MKEKVRNALNRAKEEGVIAEDQDIFDVEIDIPGIGLVTYEELTESMAELALDILNKMIANKSKFKEKEEFKGGFDDLFKSPEEEPESQSSEETESSKSEDASLEELNEALENLSNLKASLKVPVKFSKNTKLRFPPSGETNERHKKRKMVEQLSKEEEEETEFYKTQYEPNLETKPYIQDGSGNQNPEQAFSGTPMWNSMFMWMS